MATIKEIEKAIVAGDQGTGGTYANILLIEIDTEYGAALGGKTLGARPAYAAGSAGNHHYFVFNLLNFLPRGLYNGFFIEFFSEPGFFDQQFGPIQRLLGGGNGNFFPHAGRCRRS